MADTTTQKRFLGLDGTKELVKEIKKRVPISTLTTKGDILYASASASNGNLASLTRLPIGNAYQVLQVKPSDLIPRWVDATLTDNHVDVAIDTSNGQHSLVFRSAGGAGNNAGANETLGSAPAIYVNPSTGTIYASNFAGSLNADNLTSGTVPNARLTNATPNNTTASNGTGGTAGIISAVDLARLRAMWNVWEGDDANNTVVDKVQEIITIFNNYPETTNLISTLNSKMNTTTANATFLPKTGTGSSATTGGAFYLKTASGTMEFESADSIRIRTSLAGNNATGTLNLESDGNFYLITNKGGAATDYYGVQLRTNSDDNTGTLVFDFPTAGGTLATREWANGKFVPFNSASGNVDFNYKELLNMSRIDTDGSLEIEASYDMSLHAGEGYIQLDGIFKAGYATLDFNPGPNNTTVDISFPGVSGNVVLDTNTNAFTVAQTFKHNIVVANSQGTTVATINSTGITLATPNNNGAVLTWDELALISNGEISAADVAAMF